MSRKEYRERKFGSPQVVAEMDRRMMAVGAQEGIAFALDKIQKTPNTFDAHRLLWKAETEGVQDAVADGIFRAFFTEGRDIGRPAVLTDIAAAAGMDRQKVSAFLASDEGSRDVRAEEDRGRQIGIDAVPAFIIGGKYLVGGAQSPEVFLEAFDELTRSTAKGS